MLRIGFSIILNGIKHLEHNDYAKYLINNCLDYWIIVEGASQNDGSTNWVEGFHYMNTDKFHHNGSSIDGTVGYLNELQKKYSHKVKVIFPEGGRPWYSKDEMVNKAIEEINKTLPEAATCYFLWQIDIDEQWTEKQMSQAEFELYSSGRNCGMFHFNQFVGKNLIAVGPNWGGNTLNRLWIWSGQKFKSHEPAELENQKEPILLSPIFDHYSYYYSQDVLFKALWYYDDLEIYKNWLKIQELPKHSFPIPLKTLFSKEKYIYYCKDAVIKYKKEII